MTRRDQRHRRAPAVGIYLTRPPEADTTWHCSGELTRMTPFGTTAHPFVVVASPVPTVGYRPAANSGPMSSGLFDAMAEYLIDNGFAAAPTVDEFTARPIVPDWVARLGRHAGGIFDASGLMFTELEVWPGWRTSAHGVGSALVVLYARFVPIETLRNAAAQQAMDALLAKIAAQGDLVGARVAIRWSSEGPAGTTPQH